MCVKFLRLSEVFPPNFEISVPRLYNPNQIVSIRPSVADDTSSPAFLKIFNGGNSPLTEVRVAEGFDQIATLL